MDFEKENIPLGKYIAAMFISVSEETRIVDNKSVTAGYLLVAIGGRKGAINVKFDPSESEFTDFISGLSLGDEILAGVNDSAFNGSVYYSLRSIAYLRKKVKSPASAVEKMEAAIKSGGGQK